MHYPDSRWRPRCQGKSRDDVSGGIKLSKYCDIDTRLQYRLQISN